MKNLYAAVVFAIIVFFLSSCGEAEIPNVSSRPDMIVESKITEQIISSQQEQQPPKMCEVTISAEEMIVSKDNSYSVTFQRPTEFSKVVEGQEAKITIEDYNCGLVFVRSSDSQQKLLEGFELKKVCFGNVVKMEGEIEAFTEPKRRRLLLKQDDGYVICVGDRNNYIKTPDKVDSIFISTSGVYYTKKQGNIIEIGHIENIGINYELVKAMELKTKDGYLFTIYDEFYKDEHEKTGHYDISDSFNKDYNKHRQAIERYMELEAISSDDVRVELFLEEKNLSFVFKGAKYSPEELYFNGKLICKPSELNLEGEYKEGVDITYTGDKMLIIIYNMQEIFYSDTRIWLCFGDKIVEFEEGFLGLFSNLKDLELNEDGKFEYRRFASGGTLDYLYYKSDGFYGFDTFEEFLEDFERLWGDEMPDVDEPYYEYGEIVLEGDKAVYKPTHTRSIRQLYEEEAKQNSD